MQERGETFKKEYLGYLSQLVNTLEETLPKLKTAYEKKEYENFDKLKRFILQITTKIAEVTK